MKHTGPKVLVFDIETSPILGFVWSLWDQNVGLNQIHKDWHLLSWAAKWLGEKEMLYADQSKAKDIQDDSGILKKIWELLDEADIVLTKNGKRFDVKKLNARFAIHGMKPPSPYRHIDMETIARKYFAFTSNKLEYLSDKLNKKYKKLKHKKFPGFELWVECLKGNKKAWKELEIYNKYDVLSTEELYQHLSAWDTSINFNVYHDDNGVICQCGSSSLMKYGYCFTNTGKFQRYRCNKCGASIRDKKNLIEKTKKSFLKVGTAR